MAVYCMTELEDYLIHLWFGVVVFEMIVYDQPIQLQVNPILWQQMIVTGDLLPVVTIEELISALLTRKHKQIPIFTQFSAYKSRYQIIPLLLW